MEDTERRPKNVNYGVQAFWCLMLLLLVIAVLIFTLVYVVLTIQKPIDTNVLSTSVCNTPGCVRLASSVLETMDSRVNPCHDFYEYACGTWIKNTLIPKGRSKIDRMYPTKEKRRDTKTLLEALPKSDEPTAITKMRNLYKSCVNRDAREERGIVSLATAVETVFGGWPVLEDNVGGRFNSDSFDLTSLLAGLFVKVGSTSLLKPTVMYDSELKLVIGASRITGLPSEEYLIGDAHKQKRDAYLKYMTDVAVAFGADPSVAVPEMQAVLDLEQQLAQAKQESEITPTLKATTVAEMQARYPEINWILFLKDILPELSATITDEFVVYDQDSNYLRKALDILKDVPERLVADWVMWLCYHDVTLYLTDEIRNAYYEFATSVYGTPPKEYYEDCVDAVTRNFPSAIARLQADNNYPVHNSAEVYEIFGNLRRAQVNLVNNTDFDDETKQWILNKTSDVDIAVAYPEYILDNDLLNKEYEGVPLPGDNIVNNLFSVFSLRVNQNMALLTEDGFENEYLLHRSMENQLDIRHENLLPPIYNQHSPWFVNYGNLGMIMARDLTNAIASAGIFKDDKIQCVQSQYGYFFLPENGKTVGTDGFDNIIDNAGLLIATKAFMKEMENRKDETLPGLDMTVSQLFFLNNAQLWCEKYTRKYADETDKTPGRFRVNGMMQNSAEFSKAFECPKGSSMNPESKCAVY